MARHIADKGEHPIFFYGQHYDAEIAGLAGYPELLFFGALAMLLASWLALSYDHYAFPHRRLWRSIAYGCWGLVAGLGFWSDFLMLVFNVQSPGTARREYLDSDSIPS